MQNDVAKTEEKVKSISVQLIIVLAIFTVILLLFLFITKEFVLEKEGNKMDVEVFEFLKPYTSPDTTTVMNIFTFSDQPIFFFLLILYWY